MHQFVPRSVSALLPRRFTCVMLSGAAMLFALAPGLAAQPSVAKNQKVGQGLYEVAVSASTNTVYVASTGAGNQKIFALDGTTLAEKGSIDMEGNAAFGLALNDKTQTLYTSNTRAGNVSVIDLKTNKVVKNLKAQGFENGHVFRVLVDEAKNMVYVSAPSQTSQIWVIDGAKNEIVHVIPDAGAVTTGLAINPAAKLLYAASVRGNEILVFQQGTWELVKKFPSGGERSTHLAYDAKTNRLFVTNQGTGGVTVLDADSGKLLSTVKTGDGALGIQFNPKNNRIYVANRMTGSVSVIDGKTLEVISQVQTGTHPNTVALNAKTDAVYITNKARRAQRGPGKGKGDGKGEGKGQGKGAEGAPAGAPPPQPVDEAGDTVTMIKP